MGFNASRRGRWSRNSNIGLSSSSDATDGAGHSCPGDAANLLSLRKVF